MIDMAFGKKRVADRKNWLLALEPGRLKRFMHHRLFLCDLSLVDLKNTHTINHHHHHNQQLRILLGVHIDYDVDSISYDEFINRELILFSNADNERSIPHYLDGMKPSHRKVLFSCFKRNLKQEIKVAQLAGRQTVSKGS